ncbi:MAG TPA: diaminopimelate epimerase [Steroidobacteraceae bacterium]|nr:diaminopimelate epimerase [Steroidobacteraceae bacterium]
MRIEFTKMHGLGNDFIVFDLPPGAALPSAAQWRQLSDRHTGIGFDQALILEPPRRADTDAYYRIVNADGSEVEQCGNGVRCIASLLQHRRNGQAGHGTLKLDSPAGLIEARVLADGRVTVNMGVPDFEPAALPLLHSPRALQYSRTVQGATLQFGAVSMGNPHAVLQVVDVASAEVERIGQALQSHPDFPRSVNVGFLQIVSASELRLRVYERGVGETQACGTGACAAVAVGRQLGLLAPEVQVRLPGGVLGVSWEGEGQPLWMTGPAVTAFQGTVRI